MATTITVGGTAIDYRDFSIDVPVSSVGIAPEASIVAKATASISAGDSVTIDIDGTTAFEGTTTSGGTKSELGGLRVDAEHAAVEMFGEVISLTETSEPAENVLQAAVDATNSGSNFTVSVNAVGATVPSYDVSNRSVKQVFRDICDRNGWIWWVDPAGTTINVNVPGGRGLWNTLDAQGDKVSVQEFDSGRVETVRNQVTVVGTGEQKVEATATDATSISTYGVRTGESPYNVAYITTQSEAQSFADALLIPDPLAEAKLLVSQNVGDIVSPLANYDVEVIDNAKNISADNLVVKKQTIEQGRATLTVSQGGDNAVAELNRRSRSRDDVTEPGSVYSSDRLATDAVTIDKISQDAVDTDNIVDAAVIEQKLSNLSVSETKIQDNSISTPKLQASSVVSDKITAGAVDTLQLAAEAVFADKIASDTITANEIDVLDLNTGELTVSDASLNGEISFANENINGVDTVEILQSDTLGNGAIGTFGSPWEFGFFVRVRPDNDDTGFVGESAAAYSEMWAYDYFDAATDTAINDGGDPLDGLADGHGPPDHAAVHDDETGEVKGHSLNEMARSVWDVVRAQQRRIDDLESRLSALEGDNA